MRSARVLSAALALAALAQARQARAPEPDLPPSELAVWTFGSNLTGQLGRMAVNHHVPGAVPALSGVVSMATGLRHTLALKNDGTVWAWGDNAHGQLGVPGSRLSLAPLAVPGLTGITAIAAGGEHSVAYRASDAKLWLWGSNELLQAGQPQSVTSVPTPTEVVSPGALVEIRAGGFHTLLVDAAGGVWGCGSNGYGALGNGTTNGSSAFVAANVTRIVDLAAGLHHNAAVDEDGVVWTWGLNSFGQLGRGTQGGWTEALPDPRPAIGLPPIARVAAGQLHALALARDGRVFGWGYNTSGQVGDGSILPANTGRLAPAELSISGVVDIAAGGIHSLALDASGALWIWGSAALGALGNNRIADVRVPEKLLRLPSATAIAAGGSHSVVLAKAPGPTATRAAGRNDQGQLGDGTSGDRADLAPVAIADAIQLSGGQSHSLALLADGRVLAWGNNDRGQLGVSNAEAGQTQVVIPLSSGQRVVLAIAGGFHNLALRSDGRVWAWGDGSREQLGSRGGGGSATPVLVEELSEVVFIAAGLAHSVAVKSDGSLWAWGDNSCGQLGQPPTVVTRAEPTQVLGVAVAGVVAAGYCHSFVSSERGVLYAWGQNSAAQLGDDSVVTSRRAVPVVGVDDVTAFAAGAYHGLAVSRGKLVAWGEPNGGTLGTGTSYPYWRAREVAVATDIEALSAGAFHSLALDSQGRVYAWGSGWRGQLGLGAPGEAHAPTAIAAGGAVLGAGRAHTLIAVR